MSCRGIGACPDERLRFEDQTSAGLELGHAAGYFITESATLVVWKFQVELAEPTSSGLDRAPIVVEGVERDLPRLRHDGDMPEARVGKQPLEMIGIREGR
jgi:hypothetical protein